MNKSKLKSYAPQARKDFIAAVTARANFLGLSEAGGKLEVATGERKGDIAIIAGREWSAKVFEQRDRLIKHIKTVGFSQTMEAVAYTWFNRFAALRYMEIHDYLDHGHRVLSNREGGMPEILNHAAELELPGFNKAKAVELKLAGNKDGELYKMLLVAQCNALSRAMPFLFERIDDETELLLPDNLLRTDSIIAKLVAAIPEEDWQEVEIIGWLYQFYISEKKDEVIGKVVKSEDIPAATQLFTPNWIVQYLVQNSVGRLWLMANPASTLKSQWPYYIEPAEQTPEVQAQLDALIQTRMSEDGGSLNPETITVLDPACGSGHILVVAYDVLKAIYLERGYQLRAIPRLILEKNLYGLDIDDRAAQLAGFALLMKARADDRRLLDNPPKLNVLALQESKGLNTDELARALQSVIGRVSPQGVTRQTSTGFGDDDLLPGTLPQMNLGELVAAEKSVNAALTRPMIAALIDTFAHAKTFGSLIQIPQKLNTELATMTEGLQQAIQNGDLYAKAAAQDLMPLVEQAIVLGMQFDAVAANPPYMGGKGMLPKIKEFAREQFPRSKTDLFAMFMERGFLSSKPSGFLAMVTMQSWMFLSSYEELRDEIIDRHSIFSFLQIGYNSFPEMNSKIAQACAFAINAAKIGGVRACFGDLNNGVPQSADKGDLFARGDFLRYEIEQTSFRKVPGSPLIYWASKAVIDLFASHPSIGTKIDLREGIHTANNEKFLRFWHEMNINRCKFNAKNQGEIDSSGTRWVPYNKGGSFRKWFGNNDLVIAFDENSRNEMASLKGHVRPSQGLYFKAGGTWSALTSGNFGVRYYPEGFLFDSKGQVAVGAEYEYIVALMNSKLVMSLAKLIMPTLDYKCGDVKKLPYIEADQVHVTENGLQMLSIAKMDWDAYETSWDFQGLGLSSTNFRSVENAWSAYSALCVGNIERMKFLEYENNSLIIEASGIKDELSPDVPEDQITLARADREKDCQRLISYAIGCMMGRYSLDEPGLIYAHAANVGFDATRYQTFPADADGIVPLTDELWFEDDAANRIREFLLAVWGAETLEENLSWLAESLGKKGNETPEETIRRYLSGSFFKDHCSTYKKRPIYWLFSSGKQGAFQALVYLHRYHEGTLARMRSEYVVPLTGKIQSRIEMLTKDAEAATSTAARNKLNKEIEGLRKKHVELLSYDEKLRHYADMRIKLDLDDGVKVNYGKFGDLLAETKAICGNSED